MDIKTLEYMEERVQKGRKITATIDMLKDHIKEVTGNHMKGIQFSIGSGKLPVTKWGELAKNEFEAHVEASMINTFIDITKLEIKRLEQQLHEL